VLLGDYAELVAFKCCGMRYCRSWWPRNGNNGKLLYFSDQKIDGAEAYFANSPITII